MFVQACAFLIAALVATGALAEPPRRVLEVGPSRAVKTPSAAAAVAKDGDHIKIDAATYVDCAVWRADNLVLEGVGGTPQLRDKVCENQAIWLILGDRILVKNVAFSGARAPGPNNGAGIKFLAASMTVEDSKFHDNENGILTKGDARGYMRIANSVFADNGKCEPDCAHGVYIGWVGKVTITGSTFRHQHVGHHIKSKAQVAEIIGNRIEDGVDGNASFSVDLPFGGSAMIRQNYFQKGPKSPNRMAMISYGTEGNTLPGRGVYIGQNSFLTTHPHLDAYVRNHTPNANVVLEGNRFVGGRGMRLKGPGKVLP